MFERRDIVEKELGVNIPADYAKFLDEYGTYEEDDIEIYGLDDEVVDINKIPCVIGATKILRKAIGLPKRFLVIQHTGHEGEIICLDTRSGAIYRISSDGMTQDKIAESFGEWFNRDILEE